MTQFEKLDLLLRECGGTIQTFPVSRIRCNVEYPASFMLVASMNPVSYTHLVFSL